MKSVTLLLKGIIPFLLVLITTNASWAQFPLPVCSGNGAGKVYVLDETTGAIGIMRPNAPLSAGPTPPQNPQLTSITVPPGSRALAIGTNYGTGPNPTYYTTTYVGFSRYLHYWNGSAWSNTGVIMNVDHITGSCGAIFGYDTASGVVWKWPGLVPTVTFFGNVGATAGLGSNDIVGDCTGGFWILKQTGADVSLKKYSGSTPSTLLQTFALTGTFVAGGSGLALNGNKIYYDGADGNLYEGTINTTLNTVNFVQKTSNAYFNTNPILDFASCGFEGFCLGKGALDSVGACADTANVPLTATGPGPYNWTVVSGPAFITGNGQSVMVTAAGPSVITYKDADCGGANTIPDTTVVFVTSATVDAGLNDTLIGCRGYFMDTLHATVTDTTIGVSYAYDWTPLGDIISGNTTLEPIINPAVNRTYTLTVTTLNGCTWQDTIRITVADSTPKANFTYIANLGCDEDTVRFINTTPTNPYINYILWDFDDTLGNNGQPITSTAVSPTHIYKNQGIYSVLLTVSNQHCLDTFRQFVNVLHPIIAKFNVDDSACMNEILPFTDQSTITTMNGIPPTFFYAFGDGDTSILASPTHAYLHPGVYTAMLAIRNGIGCTDTTYRTIVIDSIPFVNFVAPDSAICEGESIRLIASYLSIGNTGVTVDLGDGTVFQGLDTVTYAYAKSGPYNITLTAHYRSCRDTVLIFPVAVNPFPGVDLGPDTVLCPNGSPIVLSERVNFNNPAAKFLWKTGEKTASILAKDIGTYWVRATLGGCSGTDSIMVNKDCYVNIPNSFTPDGDGTNDYFLPRQFLSRSANAFKMSIFNRWGQVIYESSTIGGRGWDGKFNNKEQPQGVYVYIIDVTFDNGVKEHYTGNVTLLR